MARKAVAAVEEEAPTAEEQEILGVKPPEDDIPIDTDDDEDDQQQQSTEEKEQETEGQEEEVEADKVKTVPHGALHEERSRRKVAEANFSELQNRHNILEQRMNIILQRMMTPQPEPEQEKIPDKNADPFAYMDWMEKRLAAIETGRQQDIQQQQQQAQQSEAIRMGNTLAAQVREKNPEEYDGALQFLVSKRAAELRALGTPDHQIPQVVNSEMTRGMMAAMQQRRNPGEFMIEYAKAAGFTYKKAAPENLEKIAEAQRQNRTLGSGKSTTAAPGTVEAISRMSDDEFEAWYSKNGKKGFARIFAE